MKRLTERDEFGNADIIGVDSVGLQGNLIFEELNPVTRAINRLAELEDKLESGQLVELNSKPLTLEEVKALKEGDWVWIFENECPTYTGYYKINEIGSIYIHFMQGFGAALLPYELYGETWLAYKNKEQAEARLKEL